MARPSRSQAKLSTTAQFNVEQKRVLSNLLRKNPYRLRQGADSTANATTTLGNSTYLLTSLEAGREYKITGLLKLTNGTAANGIKTGINLTGTQTSAVCEGIYQTYDVTNSALTTDDIALSSGAFSQSDAAAAAAVVTFELFIVPQNDGIFSVQFAEQANGGGTAVLKKNSFIEITEVED